MKQNIIKFNSQNTENTMINADLNCEDYQLQIFDKDMVIEKYKGCPNSIKVDFDNCGLKIIACLDSPTPKEIRAFSSDYKIRLLMKSDVIFFLLKFGNLNWLDAPYSIYLSHGLRDLPDVPPGAGYSILILVVDTKTGKPVKIRVTTLNNKLSILLKKLVDEQKKTEFNFSKYSADVQSIYSSYSTKDLLKISSAW